MGKSDLSELSGEVNKSAKKDEAVLYSKKPIRVGDKWTPVGKDVAKFFAELSMDPASVKAQGKLTKAYKKAGKQWGTVELVITFDADLGEIKKAKGEIKATIDQAIDGSSTAGKATFEVTMIAKQTLEKDCKKYVVDYMLSATIRAERADEE